LDDAIEEYYIAYQGGHALGARNLGNIYLLRKRKVIRGIYYKLVAVVVALCASWKREDNRISLRVGF
jgi:hypothetical protein